MTPAIAFNDTFPFQFLKLFLLFVARKKPKTKTKTDQPFPNQFPINNSHFSTNFGNFPPISRQRRWIRRAWLRHWVPLRTLAEYTKIHLIFFFLFQTEGNLDRPIRRENDTNLFLVISPVLYYHFVCLCFCVREKEKERERARVSFSLVFLLLVASFVFVSPSAAAFKVTRRSARSNRGTEGHRHFRIGTLSRFALTVDGSADT